MCSNAHAFLSRVGHHCKFSLNILLIIVAHRSSIYVGLASILNKHLQGMSYLYTFKDTELIAFQQITIRQESIYEEMMAHSSNPQTEAGWLLAQFCYAVGLRPWFGPLVVMSALPSDWRQPCISSVGKE